MKSKNNRIKEYLEKTRESFRLQLKAAESVDDSGVLAGPKKKVN